MLCMGLDKESKCSNKMLFYASFLKMIQWGYIVIFNALLWLYLREFLLC